MKNLLNIHRCFADSFKNQRAFEMRLRSSRNTNTVTLSRLEKYFDRMPLSSNMAFSSSTCSFDTDIKKMFVERLRAKSEFLSTIPLQD